MESPTSVSVAVLWSDGVQRLARHPAGGGGARQLLSGHLPGLWSQCHQHILDKGVCERDRQRHLGRENVTHLIVSLSLVCVCVCHVVCQRVFSLSFHVCLSSGLLREGGGVAG